MQLNITGFPSVLTMESLGISSSGIYPAFFLGMVTYCLIVAGNLTIFLTIALNRSLHKPMYLLLLNLPINDLIGATAFFPQLISSIILQNRSISYPACFLQALLVHLYAGGAFIILTAMAYDRYMAICHPLRYNTVMSNVNLVKIIVIVWIVDVVLISVLFCLLARFQFCQSLITDMYCNNPSLVKLICENTSVNNYYGLFLSSFLQGMSLITVIFTYIQILIACLVNKQSDTRSKALRTCATHLMVFVLFQVTTIFAVLSHRFNEVSPYLRRSVGISILVFPPILNPLIYGLNTKEIRTRVIHFCTKKTISGFNE
ncbi:olfactory receptor 52J3-like [Megalops cyprinoides]|uniref:olfactory receptor 52J3-like n=1 Tax=Megalops cyprinoides TaxID=118141 RepID=UPI001865467E|nr:olfactory receptor 52J3-like [Megalops cyprinoides]